MPVTDDRILPLAKARIYAPGQAEPVVIDHGHGSRYDVLAESAPYGAVSFQSGEPALQYLEGIGLVCRPFLVLQDTRLSHYTGSTGSWEEERPATGSPRKYRLVQYSGAVNTEFSRTSAFVLPANPDIAISFVAPDTPTTQTNDAYLRFELGNANWALDFNKTYGARLLKKVSGAWQAVLEIPEPAKFGNSDHEEVLVLLRCLRGKICLSTDRGRTYAIYAEPGVSLSIVSSSWTIRGQGGVCVVGLHQLRYYAGTYTAPRWNTFTSRPSPSVLVTAPSGCKREPFGTTVTLTDTGNHPSQVAGYTATLTPLSTSMGTPGWAVYRTPELYAVWYEFPATLSTPSLYSSEPWEGAIVDVTIDKPLELDAAGGSLRIRHDPSAQFVFQYGRWPVLEVDLGHLDEAGVTHYTTVLRGYVRVPHCETSEYNAADLSLAADNISMRFKRAKWPRGKRLPVGGQSVNSALLAVLISEGAAHLYPAHLRHPAGDALILPFGLPEDPFEWPPEGEDKWETLRRIAGYAGLEMVPLDSGYFETIPKDYVSPVVTKTWEMTPATDLKNLVQRVGYGYDSSQTVTAIEVYGVSETGEELLAYYVNAAAETNPFSSEFCPWRETHVERISGTCNMVLLVARCQALAQDLCTLKQEADVSTPVDLTTSRRDRGRLTGCRVGINDTDEFVALTLQHRYRTGMAECETTAGLRRVR